MPATSIRNLRLEPLEDRQMMHAGPLAADAPSSPTGPTDALVVAFEVDEANNDQSEVAVDAYFQEIEASDAGNEWTTSAWAGLAFCVSSALNQTVLSRSTTGYVFDLKKLVRKQNGHEGTCPPSPAC